MRHFHIHFSTGRRFAFTLIELLVVVAIIALLISILLPSLTKAREQAKRVQCAAHQHQIGIGLGSYAAESRQFLPLRGGYGYNIKETIQYHWAGGSKSLRQPVNHGALYPKYCGGEGVFYYCPANPQWGYYDTTYGWPTFKYDTSPPGPALNWGGFHYAVPVVPGCYPKDDGRLSFTIPAALFPKGIPPSKSPSAPVPDGYGGLYDSRYVQYPAESGYQATQGYIQVALRQKNAFTPPYMGKSMAVLTDALFGAKAHRALGFNVLFTDYHAKWVPGNIPLKMNNETRPLAKWDGTSGTVASPPPRMGMWNVLSSKP